MSQDLDIALLRTFVAIVDTGGLTSAGRRVGRTQPAITHQIKRLEDLIGRTLFEDNRRKLSLTHDGEVLLEFARAILKLNAEARARFSAPDIAGHVTLGTPDLYASYILPEVLETFSRSHPNVEIELRCTRSVQLHAALEREEIDIALMTNQPDFRRGELVRREGLVWVAGVGSAPELRNPIPLAVLPQGECIAITRWRPWAPPVGNGRSAQFATASPTCKPPCLPASPYPCFRAAPSFRTCAALMKRMALPKLPSIELVMHRKPQGISEAAEQLAQYIARELGDVEAASLVPAR